LSPHPITGQGGNSGLNHRAGLQKSPARRFYIRN
jgi:hypothetical protein